MSTKYKAAIAAVSAALEGYDFLTHAETDIAIDTTAGKQWEPSEIHALPKPVCYVSRINRTFSQLTRSKWFGSPAIAVTVIYSVQADAEGQPDQHRFDRAEAVLENAIPAVEAGLPVRFSIVEIDQPVGFDDERMAHLIYVSQIVFTLSDKEAVL